MSKNLLRQRQFHENLNRMRAEQEKQQPSDQELHGKTPIRQAWGRAYLGAALGMVLSTLCVLASLPLEGYIGFGATAAVLLAGAAVGAICLGGFKLMRVVVEIAPDLDEGMGRAARRGLLLGAAADVLAVGAVAALFYLLDKPVLWPLFAVAMLVAPFVGFVAWPMAGFISANPRWIFRAHAD